jgi:hypothetical protein
MLIDAERSQLLLIDLQEKMMPAIADEATIVANWKWSSSSGWAKRARRYSRPRARHS